MKVILIVVCALGIVLKDLEKEWKNCKSIEESRTSRLQNFLDRPEYLVLQTCCHSDFNQIPSSNAGGKNLQGMK